MSARSSGTFMTLSVVAQHRGTTYSWSEEPGIEHWTVELLLSGKMPGSQEDRSVIIAAAEIWRIDNNLCLDQVFELDCISNDLAVVGDAIDSSKATMSALSLAEGMNSSYAIADLVLVDKHWRGRRIGPALVFFAADLLKVDAVFLQPVALTTFLTPDGRVDTDYWAPRPGAAAQNKVRKAWRRAGFRKLADGVVWTIATADRGAAARAMLERLEEEAGTASGRAWWLRRVRHVARQQR